MAEITGEDIQIKNKKLVKEIIQYCNRADYKKHRVMLIGQSGSGKSSIINTLRKAVTGTFISKAKSGSGDFAFQSNTLELKWYPTCAANEADFETTTGANSGDASDEDSFGSIWTKLPDIFDAAGMRNANTDETKEILRLFIGGFVDADTSIQELERLQREKGLGFLKKLYNTSKDENKISLVVFARECGAPIPDNLIKCLREVLREVDSDALVKKDECDVIVLLTKYDTVYTRGKAYNEGGHVNVTEEKLRETEETAKAFGIKGAEKCHSLHWESYHDAIGYDNPYIDNTSLKFLKMLTTPTHTRRQPPRRRFALRIYWVELVHYLEQITQRNFELNIKYIFAMLALFVLVLGVLFAGILTKPVR